MMYAIKALYGRWCQRRIIARAQWFIKSGRTHEMWLACFDIASKLLDDHETVSPLRDSPTLVWAQSLIRAGGTREQWLSFFDIAANRR